MPIGTLNTSPVNRLQPWARGSGLMSRSPHALLYTWSSHQAHGRGMGRLGVEEAGGRRATLHTGTLSTI